jgi:hypothetical protein
LNKNSIEKYISYSRLNAYKSIEEYKQNILYSQEYYILLCILEISLRNSINYYFKFKFGNDWNNHKFLHYDSLAKIKEVQKRIILSKKELTHEQIISELSFGFWSSLFRKSYTNKMRLTDLKYIFPNLPFKKDKLVTRDYINKKLNHIRKFRNRIFHYEKIINNVEYKNIKNDIFELLLYFHKDIYNLVNELISYKKANR